MRREFVRHKNYLAFLEVVESVRERSAHGDRIAAVYGEPGTGKTLSAQRFAVDSDAIYISCHNLSTSRWLLTEIGKALKLPRYHSTHLMLEEIVGTLSTAENNRIIIIDEMDIPKRGQKYDVLETVRGIHDAAKSPFILMGMHNFPRVLSYVPHLLDRMCSIRQFQTFTDSDVMEFANILLEHTQLERSAASLIQRHSLGRLRKIMKYLLICDRFARRNKLPALKADDIEETFRTVLTKERKHG
ncbi:MAG: ATP-binding protein [Chloroflexi bacterium]|nr:MAG: ATP-binding protein [Chloroflexota bacterium]